VTGACFADLGNTVTCIDIDRDRIAELNKGHLPIYEPGLEELVSHATKAGRLRFTTDYAEALDGAGFAFIAVGTPSGASGEADMRYAEDAARSIAGAMTGPLVIVNKSTMPIGAGDAIGNLVRRELAKPLDVTVVSNPEFLREGSAVTDFFGPDRIVLGAADRSAAEQVAELYRPLNANVIITDMRTAEMVKYASNAFLATKISFINEIAAICDRLGADVTEVARGMGFDKRIGRSFLDAGLGYGGSCFPKDVRALEHMASINGCHPQLLRAVMEINRDVRRAFLQKLRGALGSLDGKTIGVLGLAFKPNTDDLRDAPALELIHLLKHEGATVRAYDPAAKERASQVLTDVYLGVDAYDVATGCDALALVTEWNEFKELDMAAVRDRMRTPILIDGRNIYNPDHLTRLGFQYVGMGRAPIDAQPPGAASRTDGAQVVGAAPMSASPANRDGTGPGH
jgi:UDPglucose 6-dehydrogenase